MYETLIENLTSAMQKRGVSAAELAKQAELKPTFIYDILNGKSRNPSMSRLAKIAAVLDIHLTDLLGIEEPPQRAQHGEGYALVSKALNVSFDSGGRPDVLEQEADPYYFRRSWLRNRLGSEPENLRLVRIEGDSMEPTLCHGDVVLVDISRKNPSPPGIFVIFDGMGLLAKRIEYLAQSNPPSIRILSDNPQYHPYERKVKDTHIVGRVVWFAREI